MGKRYSKILLAVDFHDDNAVVVETAQDLTGLYNSELHIVHVNEPLGMIHTADGISWGDQIYALEASSRKESQKKMNELAHELKLPDGQIHLLEGRPAPRIHELCEAQNFDLIVLGTHGQAGLQLLLGSTANSVLQGSGCDVLAIRIG